MNYDWVLLYATDAFMKKAGYLTGWLSSIIADQSIDNMKCI